MTFVSCHLALVLRGPEQNPPSGGSTGPLTTSWMAKLPRLSPPLIFGDWGARESDGGKSITPVFDPLLTTRPTGASVSPVESVSLGHGLHMSFSPRVYSQ